MDKSTGIRVNESTIASLRLTASELAAFRLRKPINSDNDRILALIDYWHETKTQTSPEAAPLPRS